MAIVGNSLSAGQGLIGVRVGQIKSAIGTLEYEVGRIEGNLIELVGAVSPALSTTATENAKCAEPGYGCQLASDIQGLALRIRAAADLVKDTEQRVEL